MSSGVGRNALELIPAHPQACPVAFPQPPAWWPQQSWDDAWVWPTAAVTACEACTCALPIAMGVVANEVMTSISHAISPSTRRLRECAKGRSETVMPEAYRGEPAPSTLEAGPSALYGLLKPVCRVILSPALRLASADGGKWTLRLMPSEVASTIPVF